MFSAKSPGEDSGGNPVQIIQSLPGKDRESPWAAWRWRRAPLCSANTWLVRRSRDVFSAAVGRTLLRQRDQVCVLAA